MFNFIEAIAFVAFETINTTRKSGMIPLPTILVLRNTKVHICSSNSSNITSYIETSVNKAFCYNSKILEWVNKKDFILGFIHKNSIGLQMQTSLLYIP